MVRLPSIRSLQAFLAVLSTGSTVEAARSLNMTQSAVSKQIAALETALGTDLFARIPGGLAPTEAAKMYEPHARIAVDTLHEGAARLDEARRGPRALLLHLLPIIGERWLTDRFPEFEARYPGIDVQFTNQVTDATIRPPDAAFRHGLGDWPETRNLYLLGRDHLLVAAPALVRALDLGNVADVERITLLQHFQTPGLWDEFCAANGHVGILPRKVVRYGFMSLVISAAISGSGAALVPRVFATRDLAAGRLVNLGNAGFDSAAGYWLALPRRATYHPDLAVFTEWVLAEAAALVPK